MHIDAQHVSELRVQWDDTLVDPLPWTVIVSWAKST